VTPDARELAEAVGAWLAALDRRQRERASFPFDSSVRFDWGYVPGPREGLPLGDMTVDQRDAAMGMVRAAMSARGATEVQDVIDLEPILGELERAAGRGGLRRDPGRYWFAVFGNPGGDSVEEPWAWRLEGHHVSISSTVAGGAIVSTTPSFLGSNPATVPSGPIMGRRALDGEESLARALLATLTPQQRSEAVVDAVAPPDIRSGTDRRAHVDGLPIGISRAKLDRPQIEGLDRLIRHYLGRMRENVAEAAWQRIVSGGLEAVTFAWAGPDRPGQGHYYAIVGPTLMIEYDNTQNGANHIHSVWRDPANDWGDDLLAAHYRAAHAG
jgi:hypothetical protein